MYLKNLRWLGKGGAYNASPLLMKVQLPSLCEGTEHAPTFTGCRVTQGQHLN